MLCLQYHSIWECPQYYECGKVRSGSFFRCNTQGIPLYSACFVYCFLLQIQKIYEDDLKEKKVYNYYIEPTIVITSNEENIETIKANRQKYYRSETNYSSCNFVRTYYVEMIRENASLDEYSVVLSEYDNDSLVTVRLDSSLAKNLEVGNYYEFTFKTYQAYVDTDILDIFEENEVVAVRETDKKAEEQIREDSCSIFY